MLGKTISHYKVTRSLGAGGMGEVYAAADTLLGRDVAIKVLRTDELVTAEGRLRFLQEARAASALNHPNIVTIYDVVRERSMDCIVMELVHGETLEARVARGALPLDEALDILRQIADALVAAHARGIVHRDLKPGNVMLTPSGGVKVLDFGLAKLFAAVPAGTNTPALPLTQTGIVVGTPAFMSPEQVKGQPLDGRSDLFTLGTIAVEMLTGTNPFEADSAVATMHGIGYDELPPLGNVPARAAGLIGRMLIKDKEKRVQTASEVRQVIAQLLDGKRIEEPVTLASSPPPSPPSLRRGSGVAAAFVAVLIATGIAAWQYRHPSAAAPAAAMHAETLSAPDTAQDHVRVGNRLLSTYWRSGYPEKARAEFEHAIVLEPKHAGAHAGLAMAYWRRFDDDKNQSWLYLARKHARNAVELDAQLAMAHLAVGMAELALGNDDAAKAALEQTVIVDPSNATAHYRLSEVAARRQDDSTAETEITKAVSLQPRSAEIQNAYGGYLFRRARYPEAAAAYRQSIVLAGDYASPYTHLGLALQMTGDYAGAARAFQQSLEIRPLAGTYTNLGNLYYLQGLYAQAVAAHEKAVQLVPNNYVIWANLGDAYRWIPGSETKAADAFATARHLLDEEIRARPANAGLQSRKALYLVKGGDRRGALAIANALIEHDETNPYNLHRLAVTFELAGEREKSLSLLSQAIRKGYPLAEVKVDPELTALRGDAGYQRMLAAAR